MIEYWAELGRLLWTNPLYRALLIVIGAELAMVGALIIWLWVQAGRQLRRERAEGQFLDHLEAPFFDALGDPAQLRDWMCRADQYRRGFVRDFVADYLLQTRGRSHDTLVELYHEFGYADDDHQQARSMSERHRLEAMRRLYVVATAADREVLLEHRNDDYLSRMLAAQALARVGQPQDMVAMLEDFELRTQMMQAPVHAMLEALPIERLRFVFTRWQQIESGRVRAIVLAVAAQRNVSGVAAALTQAAGSSDLQVRLGASAAAASLGDSAAVDLLLDALDDDAWQVRARAAQALGSRREMSAIEPLAEALKDRAFWVRQHAAIALRNIGAPGRDRLSHVANHSDDRYAADSAAQELQRFRLFLQTGGASA